MASETNLQWKSRPITLCELSKSEDHTHSMMDGLGNQRAATLANQNMSKAKILISRNTESMNSSVDRPIVRDTTDDFNFEDEYERNATMISDMSQTISKTRHTSTPDRVVDGNESSDEEQDDSESDEFSDFDSDIEDDMFDIAIAIHPAPLPYRHNPFEDGECSICLESKKLRKRMCCSFPVCEDCMEMYLSTQVSQAIVKIECLNADCNSYVHRDEILARLPLDLKEKFYKFLIDANRDPNIKTCPYCSHVTRLDEYLLKIGSKDFGDKHKQSKKFKKQLKKKGLEIMCEKCKLEWCFSCQAPLHKGVTCKTFKKGDQLVKTWASEFHYGQQNAQRCPKCKIFIQRMTGCDHMTCLVCKTSFCYRCGDRYWSIKLLGDHFSRLSPFGCRYNFMPDRPGMRRFVRGAVFSGKILGGIVLGGMAIVAGAGLLGISVVALPLIGGYHLHKRYKKNKLQRFLKKQADTLDHNVKGHTYRRLSLIGSDVIGPVRTPVDRVVEETAISDSFPEWLVVGVQLPNSRQVEVIVHRSVSSGEAEPEHLYTTEITQPKDVSVQDGGIVTVTEVEEVINEDGSTRVIAHIVTKPAKVDSPKQDMDGMEGHSRGRKDSRISLDCKFSKLEPDGKTGITEWTDDQDDVVELKFEKEMSDDVEDETGTNETNGCFVNIFAKRLNSFHNGSIQETQDIKLPKTLLKSKSGTWEKSRKKETHYTNSLNIRNLSAIMAAHCTDREVKGQRMKENAGIFENTEANAHADDSVGSCQYDDADDGLDVSTSDVDVSCDIVTYL